MDKYEYRYREGLNGQHLVVFGTYEWKEIDIVGEATRKQDACQIVAELQTIYDGTNAKCKRGAV